MPGECFSIAAAACSGRAILLTARNRVGLRVTTGRDTLKKCGVVAA